jgi:chemotaxis signal transduction protein
MAASSDSTDRDDIGPDGPRPEDVLRVLRFGVADKPYGVLLARVMEVVSMVTVRSVPGAPSEVLGVINLRGTVLPVFDLPVLLGVPPRPLRASQYIVVAEASPVASQAPHAPQAPQPAAPVAFCFVVDDLIDVIEARRQDAIFPGAQLGSPMGKDAGALRVGDELLPLVDLDALVRADRLALLMRAAAPGVTGDTE